MIPSNVVIKSFVCEQCGRNSAHSIVTKQTKYRKFCDECIKQRKYKHNEIAKEYNAKKKAISMGTLVGRPRNDSFDKLYGNDDMKFCWDESLECGGLL